MNKHKLFFKNIIKILKMTNMDNLYLGILIKSVHFQLPGFFLFIIIFSSKIYCVLAMIYIVLVSAMYYYFGNCFISIIENELLNEYPDLKNLNVVDPILNVLDLEIDNNNRKYISIFIFSFYILVVLSIFSFRFFF